MDGREGAAQNWESRIHRRSSEDKKRGIDSRRSSITHLYRLVGANISESLQWPVHVLCNFPFRANSSTTASKQKGQGAI